MPHQWVLNGPADGVLRRDEVLKYLSMSEDRLVKLIAEGRFPAPIPMGRHHVWTGLDVACWLYLQSRIVEPEENS